jgi:hypothetical protein
MLERDCRFCELCNGCCLAGSYNHHGPIMIVQNIRIVFILITGLWSVAVPAIEFNVGVGLSDGSRDNPALQSDYARLRQDIRALEILGSQLERLGREEAPSALEDGANQEWGQQSEWLLQQSKDVTALAAETEEYLRQFTQGSAGSSLFDYQSAKFRSRQRLDAIEDGAKRYALRGTRAAERQSRAVKLIARTY